MLYFKTSNASRPYNAGGLVFTFEPVGQSGGSWLGVLSVEESAGSILAAAAYPQVTKIELAEFEAIKKKPLTRSSNSFDQPRPQVASTPAPVAPPVAAPQVSVIPEPKSARIEPPDELAKAEPVRAINRPNRRP